MECLAVPKLIVLFILEVDNVVLALRLVFFFAILLSIVLSHICSVRFRHQMVRVEAVPRATRMRYLPRPTPPGGKEEDAS